LTARVGKLATGRARSHDRRLYKKGVIVMSTVLQQAVEEPKPPNGNGEPTLTRFQQLAAQLKTAIGAVTAEIPLFELGHTQKPRFVSAHQAVPPEFIGTVAASVDPQQVG